MTQKVRGRVLFFDTETVGLPMYYNQPVDAVWNWPHMIQLGLQLYEDEELIEERGLLVKPPQGGFKMTQEAIDTHGITHERLETEGVSIAECLDTFERMIQGVKYLVAHNMAFDEKILGCEFVRHKRKIVYRDHKKICTMKSMTHVCKIPRGGRGGYKWPKLPELYEWLFDEEPEDQHDAVGDVKATARSFFKCVRDGHIVL